MSTNSSPDYDAVARRAYELYLSRGGSDGNDQNDWFQAEAELMGGNGSSKTASIAQATTASAAKTTTRKPTRLTADKPRSTKTSSMRKPS
ncbi:MAG: DUF2934 domain-containing protein [Deltaproteobacteria bacterium]|nr:DUF2934 domain-containing protein [Deltaproteobacteria bacterium]